MSSIKIRLRNSDLFVGCLHRLNYSSVGLSILTSSAKVPGLCPAWGGRVVRWYWVNFQCRGVLLIWMKVGQGPIVLAVGAGGGCLDIYSLVYHFSFSLSLGDGHRLKYCLKGPLNPKQPTNQPVFSIPNSISFSNRKLMSENIICT